MCILIVDMESRKVHVTRMRIVTLSFGRAVYMTLPFVIAKREADSGRRSHTDRR